MHASIPPRSARRVAGGAWSRADAAVEESFARLLPPSSRVERALRFVLAGLSAGAGGGTSASGAGVSIGGGASLRASAGAVSSGRGALGVADPEDDAGAAFKLTFARRWVDQRPCIERLRAYELCLDICEREGNGGGAGKTHRDFHAAPLRACVDDGAEPEGKDGEEGVDDEQVRAERKNWPRSNIY